MNLPDIEIVAERVHTAWMEEKARAGVTTRKLESGEELMVPYSELSEQAKNLDRAVVRTVYSAVGEVTEIAHKTRISDSSVYDEVCTVCGATDGRGDDRLNQPCPGGR